MKLLFCVALALVASMALAATNGTNWAVVIAGSNGYYNYRHQADVCHAYQVLHAHGIPDSQIIVMMYDDIANSGSNPVKGNIINKPNGPNVYPGVPKDYTGATVTAANFLAVLSGDSEKVKGVGSGRVLKSGPNDNVFVFFSDHGGPGLIAMPTGPYLYAKDLVNTLKSMAASNKFHQLVFYLEACESGSMFDGLLPSNINIFATTASNPDESSYACYWDETRQAYLGDLYSVSWMENSDVVDMGKTSLQQQFLTVKNETSSSHVCEYGQTGMENEVIGDFQAFDKFVPRFVPAELRHRMRPIAPEDRVRDIVDSRDVVLATLMRRLKLAKTPREHERLSIALELELKNRERADSTIRAVTAHLVGESRAEQLVTARHPVQHDCVREMVELYEQHCGRFDDYSLRYARSLSNLCAEGFSAEHLLPAVQSVC